MLAARRAAAALQVAMDSNLEVEVGRAAAQGSATGRGWRGPRVRACHTRNPYLVESEIMIVPRANLPVGQAGVHQFTVTTRSVRGF